MPGFELGEEVGRGGMGVVYRARDLAIGRDVAIKLLQVRYPPSSPAARRFVREARVTGQLQHPGIPPVYHISELPDGRPFLAMKLIKGRTLEELLKDRSADRGGLVAAFEQVCQAVAYAHANGVIHRDLKPANVMIGAFGEVQVMDWGLAKVLRRAGQASGDEDAEGDPSPVPGAGVGVPEAGLTEAGAVMGTPAYMPPEQARGELDELDQRADVFGLGGLLAAILTGKPPYVGADGLSTLKLAAAGNLTDCFGRLDGSGVDAALITLCKRCLSPDPAARPPDAGAVAKAVAEMRQTAQQSSQEATATITVAAKQEEWERGPRLWRVTNFVVLLCAMAFLPLILLLAGNRLGLVWIIIVPLSVLLLVSVCMGIRQRRLQAEASAQEAEFKTAAGDWVRADALQARAEKIARLRRRQKGGLRAWVLGLPLLWFLSLYAYSYWTDRLGTDRLGRQRPEQQDPDGAATRYQKSAAWHHIQGDALRAKGDLDSAIAAYRNAAELDPKDVMPRASLAWVLATGPDGVRDGKRAVAYARDACKLSDWDVPYCIDTLAAAHAEAGDFDMAIAYQKMALSFPAFEQSSGPQARNRLDLYSHKKPYRDPYLAPSKPRELAPPPPEANR